MKINWVDWAESGLVSWVSVSVSLVGEYLVGLIVPKTVVTSSPGASCEVPQGVTTVQEAGALPSS